MFGVEHWIRWLMSVPNHHSVLNVSPLHPCPVDPRKLQWTFGSMWVSTTDTFSTSTGRRGIRTSRSCYPGTAPRLPPASLVSVLSQVHCSDTA